MEEEFEEKMKDLREKYALEKAQKAELDRDLEGVKKEYNDIQVEHPKEIEKLKK